MLLIIRELEGIPERGVTGAGVRNEDEGRACDVCGDDLTLGRNAHNLRGRRHLTVHVAQKLIVGSVQGIVIVVSTDLEARPAETNI